MSLRFVQTEVVVKSCISIYNSLFKTILPFAYECRYYIFIAAKGDGIVALVFAAYLIPGALPGHKTNMQLLSGFPPPLSYSIYEKNSSDKARLEADVINDYKKALRLSDSLHKPLLIDFTGWACVNGRKMEENVWSQPQSILILGRTTFLFHFMLTTGQNYLCFSDLLSRQGIKTRKISRLTATGGRLLRRKISARFLSPYMLLLTITKGLSTILSGIHQM